MNRTAVINVVGLTDALIGEHTPRIRDFAARGAMAQHRRRRFPRSPAPRNPLISPAPRRTRTASSATAGTTANWPRCSSGNNPTISSRAARLWDELRERDPRFTCAKLFWWYNMYSSADYSITPRPMYPADGRKVFDIYTSPGEIRHRDQTRSRRISLRDVLGPGGGRGIAARPARRGVALDCGVGEVDRKQASADAEPDLPAASGLQLAEAWTFRSCRRKEADRIRMNPPPHVGGYQ